MYVYIQASSSTSHTLALLVEVLESRLCSHFTIILILVMFLVILLLSFRKDNMTLIFYVYMCVCVYVCVCVSFAVQVEVRKIWNKENEMFMKYGK